MPSVLAYGDDTRSDRPGKTVALSQGGPPHPGQVRLPLQVILTAVVASVVVALGLASWSWTRAPRRLSIGTTATFVAIVLRRIVLTASNGSNLDVDNPLLFGLSAEDVGSGVLAFLFTALPLGLVLDRTAPPIESCERRSSSACSRWPLTASSSGIDERAVSLIPSYQSGEKG